MSLSIANKKIQYYTLFALFYTFGLVIIWFLGSFQFEYLIGYFLLCLGYIFLLYCIFKDLIPNKFFKKTYLLISIFFIIRIFFIFNENNSLSTDFSVYYNQALYMLNGKIPFIDFNGYYGPIFYLFLYVFVFLSNGNIYLIKFFFILLDFFCIITFYFIFKHLKIKNFYKFLYIYIFSPLLFIEAGWKLHNDVGVLLIVLVSIYLILKRKYILSNFFLLIGCLYKFYPIILIPFYIIYIYKISTDLKSRVINILKFLILFIIGLIILIILPNIFNLVYYGFYIHFQRVPWGSLPIMIYEIMSDNYGNLILILFFNLVYLLLNKDHLTINKQIFVILFILIFGILSFIIPNPFGSLFILPLWLIFIVKDIKEVRNSAILLNIVSIAFCISNFLNFKEIFGVIQNFFFFSIIMILFIYTLIKFLKIRNYTPNILIFSLILALSIFLTFFWVQYPWYLLWVIPIIYIFYNKNWVYKFIIVFINIASPLIVYTNVCYFEDYASPYLINLFNYMNELFNSVYIFKIIILIFCDIMFLYVFMKKFIKKINNNMNKWLKIIIYTVILVILIGLNILSNYNIIYLYLSVFILPIILILFILTNYVFIFLIYEDKKEETNYNKFNNFKNIILFLFIIYLLRAIWSFNVLSGYYSVICTLLLCNFIYYFNKNFVKLF